MRHYNEQNASALNLIYSLPTLYINKRQNLLSASHPPTQCLAAFSISDNQLLKVEFSTFNIFNI